MSSLLSSACEMTEMPVVSVAGNRHDAICLSLMSQTTLKGGKMNEPSIEELEVCNHHQSVARPAYGHLSGSYVR